jgi:predicted dehydrogenase
LLARADVGAVIVATPNDLHKDMTLAAAAAGKHVFCEKPMALSTADVDAMIAATKAAGVKLMPGQVLRLLYPFARIAELAQEGELGRPMCVDILRYGSWGVRAGWRTTRAQCGGLLFELNIHELDFMRHLCGDVAEVSAYGGNFRHPEFDFEDVFLVNLRFQSGAVGRLRGGCLGYNQRYEGEVMCPGGTVRFQRNEGTTQIFRSEGEPELIDPATWTKPDGYQWELQSFTDWVLHDKAPVFDAQDGRAAVALAEAAVQSIASGKPVRLG